MDLKFSVPVAQVINDLHYIDVRDKMFERYTVHGRYSAWNEIQVDKDIIFHCPMECFPSGYSIFFA